MSKAAFPRHLLNEPLTHQAIKNLGLNDISDRFNSRYEIGDFRLVRTNDAYNYEIGIPAPDAIYTGINKISDLYNYFEAHGRKELLPPIVDVPEVKYPIIIGENR